MIIWIDAQLSPAIAVWICQNFPIKAMALRDLGLRDAEDKDIFLAAKNAGAVIMTKDSDFLDLLDKYGTPPRILRLTCGNTSNTRLKQVLAATLMKAITFLKNGESIVEISDGI